MKASYILAAVIAATVFAIPSSIEMAFAHPHLVVTPDETDHEQMNANPVVLTLGHSSEPAYGAKPGIHDGKHNFELSIEDAATTLPISGANLTVDRYYFGDMRAFDRAGSPSDAIEVETGIRLGGVFGEPGTYMIRQIVKDGIHGYRVYGTIDYFGVAQIPIDSTVFCTTPAGNTSKFNSPGWEGSYGCVGNIDSLLFPKSNNNVTSQISAGNAGNVELQQASIAYGTDVTPTSAPAQSSSNTFQILAMTGLSGAAVAAFFGIRKMGRRNQK